MAINHINPSDVASTFIEAVKAELKQTNVKIKVVGLIASEDKPSIAYARATKNSFEDIGIKYDLRSIERLDLESEILALNTDENIAGIFIYFPIFNNQQDDYLRNLVDYRKDIEAGSSYWTRKLYANDRLATEGNESKKALLPCTPLAIIKMLVHTKAYHEDTHRPLENKVVSIFNRSEVIGRPLAVMLSNDGAKVYSFDVNGPLVFTNAKPAETNINRATALAASDIVITGVPSAHFEKIQMREIKPNAVCINFSSKGNFAESFNQYDGIYIPRVGPMTVAMCMRNTIRLYKNFHEHQSKDLCTANSSETAQGNQID